MIVYNVTDKPIVIIAKWHPDPSGGPAFHDETIMIFPGEGIQLSIIGLEPKE